MSIEDVLQAISTVGFPIAACVALFTRDAKMQEQHKAETEKMTEAINNNTHAITILTERMKQTNDERGN